MGAVKIDSGPPDATDRPYRIPKEKWRQLVDEKRTFLKFNIQHDCRCLLEFIDDAEEMWEELGFSSRDDLIVNGYELDPAEVDLAIAWLKIKEPDFEVPLKDAIQAAREMPLPEHGNGPGRGHKRDSKTTSFNKQDRGKSYLLRRMARDFPEALDKLEAGEYKSARQAAIACGIVKVKPPLDVALTAYNKLSDDEKKAFLEQINA